jgi:hypothetical protein
MGYGGGSNAAKWAYINTGSSHWGKVYAIQKAREDRNRISSQSPSHSSLSSPVFTYKPRTCFKEGLNGVCVNCNKTIEHHTPSKKYCPKR